MKAIYQTIGMASIGLLASSTNAQGVSPLISINRDFVCYDTTQLIKELSVTFKETPLIFGKTTDAASTTVSFWVNPVTKTWTIVATKDEISCVIGVGTEATMNSSVQKQIGI